MSEADDLNELRLLGFLETGRAPGQTEVSRALAQLGIWLCHDADTPVRLGAARRYLDTCGVRGKAEVSRGRRNEHAWSIAGSVDRKLAERAKDATIEVREIGLEGNGNVLRRGKTNDEGRFAFAMTGRRPPAVEVHISAGKDRLGRTGPVRTQLATWVTWSESEAVERGSVAASYLGRFEVQRRWLRSFANTFPVESGENDEVLAAHSGVSIADIRRQRWALELAPHVGGNEALAWVLLARCCVAQEFRPETWLDEARAALAEHPVATVFAELERAVNERFVAEANRGDLESARAAHRTLRRKVWGMRRPHEEPVLRRHAPVSTWQEIVEALQLEPAVLESMPSLFDGALEEVFPRLQQQAVRGRAERGDHLPDAQCARLQWVHLVGYDHVKLGKVGDEPPRMAVSKVSPVDIASRLTDDEQDRRCILENLEKQFPGHAVLWHLKDELGDGAKELFKGGLPDLDELSDKWERSEVPNGPRSATSVSTLETTGTERSQWRVPTPVRDTLMKHQRLLRIGETKAATLAIAQAGHDSAHSIAAVRLATFVAQMKEQGLASKEAEALHARAAARVRATTALFLESVANRRSFPTAPPRARNEVGAPATREVRAAVANIPTLTELFGSLDYCECADCESLVSLSAYLVDQLLWLDRASLDTPSETAYVALHRRRPDISQIELTCTNSETQVPHIDLVCELLEDRIATVLGIGRLENRQTKGNAADVRAYPDHLNAQVYEELSKGQVFAWPFDHSLEEARGYLGQMGVDRAAVMLAFGGPEANETAELLGLSAEQLSILEVPDLDAQAKLWGSSGKVTMEMLLRRGERFLRKTIAYEALLQLLEMPFFSQGRTLIIELQPDAQGQILDLGRANQRLVKYLPAGSSAGTPPVQIDDATLDRLHRLLRLSAALGCDPAEVSALIESTHLGQGELTGESLDRMARARAVGMKLRLSPLDIAVCCGPFRDDETPIGLLFRSIFGLQRPPDQLGKLGTWLGAAMGKAPSAVAELVHGLELEEELPSTVTLARIYRHVRLLDALGSSVADYLFRCTLTKPGILGDTAMGPEDLRWIVKLDSLLRRSGVSDEALRLLGRRAPEADGPRLEALWMALLEARKRHADLNAEAFVAGRFWHDPIGNWLAVSGDDRNAAILALGQGELIEAIQTAVKWAFSRPEGAGAAQLEDAEASVLAKLLRFAHVVGIHRGRALDNPGLGSFVGQGTWETLSTYLSFAALGRGALANAYPLFARGDEPKWPGDVDPQAFALALGLERVAAEAALEVTSEDGEPADAWDVVEQRLDLVSRLKLPANDGSPADDEMDRPQDGAPELESEPIAESGFNQGSLAPRRGAIAKVLATLVTAPGAEATRELRDAYRASIARESWLAASTVVQNALRPVRRDALLEFLLVHSDESPQDCSKALLIDTLTGAGRDRSRVGEACAAIQTFVNGLFMGLEASQPPKSDSVWNQWMWRKRYALWKGNRMVFLFPENYLSSGKRPRTSPLFKSFEDSVARGEINDSNVSAALVGYLEGLVEIADLEYLAVGSNYDSNDDSGYDLEARGHRLFTTVARARGTPGRYYFARLENGAWSPFEELKLGEDPHHVALRSVRGPVDGPLLDRHILVWPKSALLPRPNQVSSTEKLPLDGSVKNAELVLEVKYAWTERQGDTAWSAVKTTSSSLLFNGGRLPERQMLLSISTEGLRPGEFKIITHYFKEPKERAEKAPSSIGMMTLLRDTTDKVVYTNSYTNVSVFAAASTSDAAGDHDTPSDPDTWSGPAPANDLLEQHLSTRKESIDEWGKRPWSGLRFDQNRMRSLPTGSLRAADLIVPSRPGVAIITEPRSPYAVTVLPWRRVGDLPFPSDWAFLVSGVSWSFFVVKKDTFPSGTSERGNVALGFSADQFGETQAFAAVAAYHPFAASLLTLVKNSALPDLYDRTLQRRPAKKLKVARSYETDLGLNGALAWVPSSKPEERSTEESIDFSGLALHASYNMELFVFAPLLAANYLHARGRYREAQKFFHYIFNPLEGEIGEDDGEPWWITPAFENVTRESLYQEVSASTNPYAAIEESPFDAQAIAFRRRSAYQRFIVMEYLRNILAWADSLRTQGDLENLDEAGQLYNLATTILGERPLQVPPIGKRRPRAFNSPNDWKPSGNVLVPLENIVGEVGLSPSTDLPALDLPLLAAEVDGGPSRLYFLIPRNDVLSSFYRRLDDALLDLRTSKSSGLRMTVDVQALVNAAATGKANLFAALAPAGDKRLGPRFRVLVTKALELCNDARSLGAAVQAASERQDAEHLAALRSSWEGRLFDNTRASLEKRESEARRELEALKANRRAVVARRDYFDGRERMNTNEQVAFALSVVGAATATVATGIESAAPAATSVPDFTTGGAGATGSPLATVTIGGRNTGGAAQATARFMAALGNLSDRAAAMASTQAGYDRRLDDWRHQKEQADLELTQVDVRIKAASFRVEAARAELTTNDRQRAAWAEQDEFLRAKFTTEDLYLWLLNQTNQLYARSFELALEMAERAKVAYVFELPTRPEPKLSNIWDPGKRGGLAAEELAFSLRQMEASHLQFGEPDVEVARRLSLKQLAPAKLIELRESAGGEPVRCAFDLPGWWLERLDPNLRERRVRSIAVSVPCIAGPNASVNAVFSCVGGTEQVHKTIHLSSGVNDRGWGDRSAESYAPFEGISLDGGSTWKLEFPVHREVDTGSIADLVMVLEYTAMKGQTNANVPPLEWKVLLDLQRDAAVAWQSLTRSSAHAASLVAAEFLPAVLADLKNLSDPKVDAKGSDGLPVGGIAARASEGQIELSGGPDVEWTQVKTIHLEFTMKG